MRDMLLSELRALFHSDCEALISFYGATYREGSVAVILEFMDLGAFSHFQWMSSTYTFHLCLCIFRRT